MPENNGQDKDSRKLFDKKIWNIHDVAEYLGKSQQHVYRLKRERNLPFRKNGTLYFYPHEVQEWLDQGA